MFGRRYILFMLCTLRHDPAVLLANATAVDREPEHGFPVTRVWAQVGPHVSQGVRKHFHVGLKCVAWEAGEEAHSLAGGYPDVGVLVRPNVAL
jgi:hypothetical protein